MRMEFTDLNTQAATFSQSVDSEPHRLKTVKIEQSRP